MDNLQFRRPVSRAIDARTPPHPRRMITSVDPSTSRTQTSGSNEMTHVAISIVQTFQRIYDPFCWKRVLRHSMRPTWANTVQDGFTRCHHTVPHGATTRCQTVPPLGAKRCHHTVSNGATRCHSVGPAPFFFCASRAFAEEEAKPLSPLCSIFDPRFDIFETFACGWYLLSSNLLSLLN